MSITQARLRAVVLAGQDCQTAFESLWSKIEAMYALDPSPGLAAILSSRKDGFFREPLQTGAVLEKEAEHLRLTWKKNLRRQRGRGREGDRAGDGDGGSLASLEADYAQWQRDLGAGPKEPGPGSLFEGEGEKDD